MTIWWIEAKSNSIFAQCGIRSPWETKDRPCRGCYVGSKTITPYPLILEWLPGSDIIGDFSWPGCGRAVVKVSVLEKIVRQFPMVYSHLITMIQDAKLKIPKNKGRARPRVWLPYEGPELMELVPIRCIPEHPNTTRRITSQCEVCGQMNTELDGYELKESRWDQQKRDLVPYHRPRVRGKGLFISKANVDQCPIFRVEPFVSRVFCTDEFKFFIEEHRFTNIDFFDYGDVIGDD